MKLAWLALVGGLVDISQTRSRESRIHYGIHPAPPADHLDDYINLLLDEYHVPGLSLAVIDNDRITAEGYGYARLPSIPATADTLWFTGSTTKAFTAAAAGIMMKDQEQYPGLGWSSRIRDYLPCEFDLEDDYVAKHVTIEDALSHRSGMPTLNRAYGWANTSLADFVKSLKYVSATADFRTTFQYSNAMVMLVSRMLEKISGSSLHNLLHRFLWEPIGMQSTFFFPQETERLQTDDIKDRLARGYYWVDDGHTNGSHPYYIPEPYMNLSHVSGAGATVSSVNDYALWVRTMLKADGVADRRRDRNQSSPISLKIYNELVKQRIYKFDTGLDKEASQDNRNPWGYALGWLVSNDAGQPIVHHPGSLRGFHTSVWMFPDIRLGIVTMSNTQNSDIVADLIVYALLRSKARSPDESNHLYHKSLQYRFEKHHERRGLSDHYSWLTDLKNNYTLHNTSSMHRDAFVGEYSHPTYGVFNITLAGTSHSRRYCDFGTCDLFGRKDVAPYYHVQPSPRTWPYDFYLMPEKGAWFQATRWVPHGMYTDDAVPDLDLGCDNPLCKNDVIMLQEGNPTFANFEFDPRPFYEGSPFQKATRFGIHLSDETHKAAEGHGKPGEWKNGVTWFDRIA